LLHVIIKIICQVQLLPMWLKEIFDFLAFLFIVLGVDPPLFGVWENDLVH